MSRARTKPKASSRVDRDEMQQFSEALTPRQQRAILLLLEGNTITDVAATLKINRVTLHRWRQTEEFLRALKELQTDTLAGAIGILKSGAEKAAAALVDAAKSGDDKEAPAVPGARAVLEFAFKGVEFEDLVRRIEELERGEKPAGPACS